MAHSVVISRSHLIYGVCLPLAVLIGYLLAEPLESGSVAVVVLVLCVLSIPVLLRWHHALLIFSCNAAISPYFMPGRPTLWMVSAILSFFFLILNRSMGQDVRLFRARNVSWSLLFLGTVALVTAYSTGGIGFGSFGAANAGGKRYFTIFVAIMLYFALSTLIISRKHAGLAISVFFLSALTGAVGYIAAIGGPGFYFLVELFPIESALDETNAAGSAVIGSGFVRLAGLTTVAVGLFCFIMARYGARGVLNLTKPWRLLMLLLAVVINLYSGFRSNMILFILTFGVVFFLEGLFRTRYFLALALISILAGAVALPYSQKLPMVVQRTLCFLPINVDPLVRANAEASTDWRLEMWREVLPTVPRYLLKGKGYGMDTEDMYLIEEGRKRGFAKGYEGAMLAGDYHSGPLSLIIPLGIFGVLGFFWFLGASVQVLRQNLRFGDPSLHRINTFLLAFFVVHILFFFFVFGSLFSDLALFAGLIGLSVSLNGGVCQPQEQASEIEPD